jgi:ABC-type multidrug transport system permease subunit
MATTVGESTTLSVRVGAPPRTPVGRALRTLAARRAALTAHNPRQIAVPLVGPALLALVVAPALKVATGGLNSHIDYTSFVGVGAVGLVVPLSCIFAGLSVIVDRHSGAQRELLAAPVARGFLVLGNLIVAIALSALQVAVLIGLSAVRGGDFQITGSGVAWFVGAALLFTVFMYSLAETLASKVAKQEDYVGAVPAVAVLPFFLAGALFPIGAMPGALTAVAKLLPLTHALALMRYGLVDPKGQGLRDIWGGGSTTLHAWLSLAVVALFAGALVAVSIRAFTRSAVK